MTLTKKKEKKKISKSSFRSRDLRVMSPARFRCANLLVSRWRKLPSHNYIKPNANTPRNTLSIASDTCFALSSSKRSIILHKSSPYLLVCYYQYYFLETNADHDPYNPTPTGSPSSYVYHLDNSNSNLQVVSGQQTARRNPRSWSGLAGFNR